MGFLPDHKIFELKGKLLQDSSLLGKLYKAKKSPYYLKNVDHSLSADMIREGWEEWGTPLKTKTKLRKLKDHDRKFEDDVWCQLYELGYRNLNYDQEFHLPFGKQSGQTKQIDVLAANEDTVLLVECKSKERPTRPKSLKTEFEGLPQRIAGFRKALEQIFHRGIKIKYIYATRNYRISSESADIKRLRATGSFFYNDNTYNYVNNLISKYKHAAFYQFQGLLFKGEIISKDRIEVPAIEGKMGKETYYMFSIEPHLLLKMSFILHRTEANESELPTYQRLLVPTRLKGISDFIASGGFFPNSIIANFSQRTNKLEFQGNTRGEHTRSRYGVLKIPHAFAIAYIIDGQHRLYGYANTERKESNTIPVVAFVDLEPSEQLRIFVDINENQKAVSASLRLTLEEDLYWDSDRADSRIKALRSSIIRVLAGSINGPLYKKIQIGEDRALLSSKPFADALSRSGLLPKARGNKYDEDSLIGAIYNTNNHNHKSEMIRSRKDVVELLNLCYGFVEENYREVFDRDKYLIVSNRGTYAFICLIGSVHYFETNQGNLKIRSTPEQRFEAIKKYLDALLSQIKELKVEESERLLSMLGSGVQIKWLREFQVLVHKKFEGFLPSELVDWMERQDDNLQNEGRKYGVAVERHIKSTLIAKLHTLFGDNWDLEIGDIKNKCETLANDEIQKQYKEGLGRKKIPWTDMFTISHYRTIIEKHWTKSPEEESEDFATFEQDFSLDLGLGGFNSKSDRLKWLSVFNSHRNLWAHEGTKEKRLNREEVDFLRRVHELLVPQS